MLRPLLPIVALSCLLLPASATEWDDLRAQYQFTTVAGGLGAAGANGNPNEWNNTEGQSALLAELSEPHMAMMDLNGRIFVADKNAHAIRRIDTDGTIHTVAGMNLNEVSPNSGYTVAGPARQCLLNGPQNAYVMPDGSFYILDSGNFRVCRVDLAGNLTTVITDTQFLNRGLWVSRDEQVIYYCTATELKRWTPGNPVAVIASGILQTGNIDVDAAGNILICDRNRMGVYRVPPTHGGGVIPETLRVAGVGNSLTTDSGAASNGVLATAVGMREPRGVAYHPLGGFFVATHRGGDVWYVDSAGAAWMFVQGDSGNTHVGGSLAVPTTFNVMSEPRSVTVSRSGDVVIACDDSGHIRLVRNVLPPPAAPVWEPMALQPAGARLRWQSDPARWYYIEQSTGLGDWSPLATLPAAGAFTEYTDAGALTGARKFYRARSFRAWPN